MKVSIPNKKLLKKMESQVEKRNSNNSKDEIGPPSALTYLDPLYWNERFAKEEHYEWFKDYSHFRHLILEHIQPHSSVLELGCGNSQLSDEMHKDGIRDITCTDLSPVAVHNLQTRVSFKGFKEYGTGNEVSMRGDVYSFGILVLEMFTGKRPTDVSFKEGGSLCDYVKSGLAEQDIRIADQALLRDMAIEDSDSRLAFEVVISVFHIALTCCTELPHERPDMSDIVGKLSSIRTKLQGIHMQQ